MIPWGLYNLTPRDQGSPNIRPFNARNTQQSVGATTLQHDFLIPDDYIALVTAVNISIISAPANIAIRNVMELYDPANVTLRFVKTNENTGTTGPGGTNLNAFWSGAPLFVAHSREVIRTIANIVAFVGNWDADFSVAGVLIPRGTIAFT